ncbi:BnaA03g12760D [Brassica napus]|uniref:BnaA03g12760D protein n=1 Tax=Brassica napus TaxID=3708 RepID=A0A078HQ49_BRANA|nr:BnaA03g12760D [Brassica napus]
MNGSPSFTFFQHGMSGEF